MNDALRLRTDGLLTTAELAARPDFTLGLAVVSPSTRTMAGPGGTADVEPRVMQVLVVLADAAGHVVTRGTLFDRCWGGVYVGDDSLNRTIGAIRKFAAEIAGGSFEVETIPRTGYRLTGGTSTLVADADEGRGRSFSRRVLIGGVAAALAAASGVGIWLSRPRSSSAPFDDLLEKSEAAVRKGAFDDATSRMLEQAVAMRPGSAKAWGLLAFVRSIRWGDLGKQRAADAVGDAEGAARKALAINPKETYALLAMFELQGSTLNWITRDWRLREIVASDPTNVFAITELLVFLQAAGMNRESLDWTERGLKLEPLSPDLLSRRALKLWIAGRYSDADKVIDQVRDLYPDDGFAWFTRFLILAMTGRAGAAQAMLDGDPKMLGAADEVALWRSCLPALERPSAENIAKTRQACFDAATTAGGLAAMGVMVMSALNDVDAAFEIADGFLLWRGPLVRRDKFGKQQFQNDSGWRVGVQWLFTPPCRVMRADVRFLPLCDGIGLVEYWRRRGIEPDYMRIERPTTR